LGHGRHKGRRAQAQCWMSTGAAAHLSGLVGALRPKCRTGQDQPLWLLSIRSNHPTAIFGERVPYPAGVRISISSQRTVSIERYLFQNLLWPYMIFKIFLSLYQVVDPVEPHLLLRLVQYLLPDPGGSHQFAQLVFTYSADWWNW